MQSYGKELAVAPPHMGFEGGRLTWRQGTHDLGIGSETSGGGGFTGSLDAAKLLQLCNEAGTFSRSKQFDGPRFVEQFCRAITQQSFRGGIHVSQPPIEADGDNHRAG